MEASNVYMWWPAVPTNVQSETLWEPPYTQRIWKTWKKYSLALAVLELKAWTLESRTQPLEQSFSVYVTENHYEVLLIFLAVMTIKQTDEEPYVQLSRLHLKCDGTRAETRFHLLAKWTSPFNSAGASVQWTTGSRGVRISGSNAGYTVFWGSVKGTDYTLHSLVSPSLPLLCITVCHHISTGL